MRRILVGLLSVFPAYSQIVALDGYHNNETKARDHYQWEGTRPGGFSELGKIIEGCGGKLRTIRERITPRALRGVTVFIIVDPDTPQESEHPAYIEKDEADAIDAWVRAGGKLVLLGNDKGNAEFEHFNLLAGRFGIRFLEETFPKVAGKGILRVPGKGSIFGDGATIYLVEVAPLEVKDAGSIILAYRGTPLAALVRAGAGEVFAIGDPWLYNEYVDHDDNRKVGTALIRRLLSNK